jgi:hypothetical protein
MYVPLVFDTHVSFAVFFLSVQSNAQLPYTAHRLVLTHRDEVGLASLAATSWLAMRL